MSAIWVSAYMCLIVIFLHHMRSKMVQPHRQFFCSTSCAVVCRNFYAAFVVFKCATSNFEIIGVDVKTTPFRISK